MIGPAQTKIRGSSTGASRGGGSAIVVTGRSPAVPSTRQVPTSQTGTPHKQIQYLTWRYPQIPLNFTTQTTISTPLSPLKRETYFVDAVWNRPSLHPPGKENVRCGLRD
jgi:hypothetical protein